MRAVRSWCVPCRHCAVRFTAGGAARRAMMDLEHEISQHATRLREPLVRRMEGIWGLGKVATWMVSMWLCCTVLVQDVWCQPGPESGVQRWAMHVGAAGAVGSLLVGCRLCCVQPALRLGVVWLCWCAGSGHLQVWFAVTELSATLTPAAPHPEKCDRRRALQAWQGHSED